MLGLGSKKDEATEQEPAQAPSAPKESPSMRAPAKADSSVEKAQPEQPSRPSVQVSKPVATAPQSSPRYMSPQSSGGSRASGQESRQPTPRASGATQLPKKQETVQMKKPAPKAGPTKPADPVLTEEQE